MLCKCKWKAKLKYNKIKYEDIKNDYLQIYAQMYGHTITYYY